MYTLYNHEELILCYISHDCKHDFLYYRLMELNSYRISWRDVIYVVS